MKKGCSGVKGGVERLWRVGIGGDGSGSEGCSIVPCQHLCPQGSDEGAWRIWGSGGLRAAVDSRSGSLLFPQLDGLYSCTLHLGQS